MILEIALVVAMFCVLLLCGRYVGSVYFGSGLTNEQIDELGEELKKIGYERKEDVDGFACFERRKRRSGR